jgi:hypothetical protein
MRPAVLLLLTLIAAGAAEKGAPEPWAVTVSANAGRAGSYQATTRYGTYNYWVCVPASYSADNPAGVHLFFHGQNGQGGAPDFGRWKKYFLEPFNLIGINMQYMDGDNQKDTEGKVAAAQQALAQVCADYKVIVPRGVVCSFSGGGLPHGLSAAKYAATRGPRWPFTQANIYSSNYSQDASVGVPMAWYIGVGTDEWSLAGLGQTAIGRAGELYRASARTGDPDVFLKVIAGKGHTILDADVETAATLFALSDLAFAPCIYVPDYADKELKDLRPAVEQANGQQAGAAAATLAKLLAKPALAEPVKAAAIRLQARVAARLDALAAMVARLAEEDPVRATYYGPLLLAQLKGAAQEKDARAALAAQAKASAKVLAAHGEFAKLVPLVFGAGGGSPTPVPEKLAQLKQLAPLLGDKSEAGLVAAGIIALGK